MRTRHLAAAALIAGGLAVGTMAGPAAAATTAAVSAQAAPSWHLAGHYQYRNDCNRTGFKAITNGGIVQAYRCDLEGSLFALYLYY
ncbi:hypothetical protein ABZU75_09840 [Streptosporangium sp. NPDC005286]|uniref:hypothetical protein n=1 Tax=Streptosporangium sp. NPDC005286 TaxID=3154463 RepID=UPI00339F9E17